MILNDDAGSICIARSLLPIRMAYLRRIYLILAVQQFFTAIVSFLLFMTPGVRPFAQHYDSTLWLAALVLSISAFCLRYTASYVPQFTSVALFFFTMAFVLVLGVVTASFDTELVYVICTMNGSVFLGHAVYCIQSSCSLRVLPSLMGTLCLATLQAWCLDSLLLVASVDYSPCIIVSFLICSYVHWNIAYFMNHLTRKEVILACSRVFTACPKLC